jgi:hypothetical protein
MWRTIESVHNLLSKIPFRRTRRSVGETDGLRVSSAGVLLPHYVMRLYGVLVLRYRNKFV